MAYPLVKERTFVEPSQRITSDHMTQYEYAAIIAQRAMYFEQGGKPHVPADNIDKPSILAKMELEARMCPLCIVREFPGGVAELWEANEMVLPVQK